MRNGLGACGIVMAVTLERDFTAWLEHRDAAALTRVFDATGGKLLLLAAHLCGGTGAQDLVQATFVAAMARGASWDRQRPLWPWLAAILHNEALMQLRRTRRRREVAIDAAGEVPTEHDDPPTLAASQEVLGAVVGAIDALPLPYRQVLRLRLVHGLRPVEIARSLEVPVGTVRAQLHRGLEQLRGALPLGVAAILAGLFTGDGALLAQVRQRVLEEAGASPATAGAMVLGGFSAMNGKTIAVVVAACVVLACVGFALSLRDWSFSREVEPLSPAPAKAVLVQESRSAAAASEAATRTGIEVASAPAWPFVVTVRAGGAPVTGASVEAWIAPRGLMLDNVAQGAFGREDLTKGTTGADGVFRGSLDALQDRSELALRTQLLWVRARSPRGTWGEQLRDVPETGATTVTVEIEVPVGPAIVGRVVDENGVPIPDVCIATGGEIGGDAPAEVARTQRGGEFLIVADEQAWPAFVALAHARHGTAMIEVPPLPAAHGPGHVVDVHDIVLAATNVIRGRVVLGDGSPLANVPVELAEIDAASAADVALVKRALALPRSDLRTLRWRGQQLVHGVALTNVAADGSFQFASVDPDKAYAVWVRIATVLDRAVVVARAGDSTQLVVDAHCITIEPRDQRGVLIPGVELHAEGYDLAKKSPNPREKQIPGFPEHGWTIGNPTYSADPEGRLLLLSPHDFVWRISTRHFGVGAATVRHDVVAGVSRSTCAMTLRAGPAFGRLHLVVTDEHGAAMSHGARLQSIDSDLSVNDDRTVPPASGFAWQLPPGQWRLRVLLGAEAMVSPVPQSFVRGYHEEVVRIDSDRTTEVKVVAKPAGQVAFQLQATPPHAARWKGLRIEEAGQAIELETHYRDPEQPPSSSGSPVPVLFTTAQGLPPGPHTFVVQAEDFAPAVCRVEVVADKLVRTKVELQPR